MPDTKSIMTYSVLAPMAYTKIKNIVERNLTSDLVYLPSSIRDMNNPEIEKYLAKYVRGSNGMDYEERIKILRLMWDAIGTEFGGRHELYEINYTGSQDKIRMQCLRQAKQSGVMQQMTDLIDRCMADYDRNCWKNPIYHNNDDLVKIDDLLK